MIGLMTTPLPPLAALVKAKHDEGRSYRDMSETARRAGHSISHSQLQAYATDGVRKAPTTDQLEAIAAALSTSVERVRTAMIEQFYGYVPRQLANVHSSKVTAVVPPDLTSEEEEELARLVAAWAAARRQQ